MCECLRRLLQHFRASLHAMSRAQFARRVGLGTPDKNGLGFLPPFAENLDILFAKTWENRVCFCGKILGAKGKCKEVQGNEGRK